MTRGDRKHFHALPIDFDPTDPFGKVKAMQTAFAPSILNFSDGYHDLLGPKRP